MGQADRRRKEAERASNALARQFAKMPGFLGAGLGEGREGRPEILVLVSAADSPVISALPNAVKGIPVRVQVVGPPEKHGSG